MKKKDIAGKEGQKEREGGMDGWISGMDGECKGQGGEISLGSPAASPGGAACAAAGRLSPLLANRGRAGAERRPPATQSRLS